jgi:hypothetical protein
MAILSNFKCEIIVDGVPLEEYDDDDHHHRENQASESQCPEVIKYVEATSGAEFAIKYTFLPGTRVKYDLCTNVHLDGKYAAGVLHSRKQNLDNRSHFIVGMDTCNGQEHYIRLFRFAELHLGKPA